MKSAALREAFLEYFRKQKHATVPSSSLVPGDDPTLLFTNAGMVQFKDVFLGLETRPYTRAVSSQRCVRAGGKHNDLENVGYTARHHTFFEMLGNFSFGDYFKREAIHYAWDFLTQTLKLAPERLWITVFNEDDEAARIWLEDMHIDPKRFSRIGASDNFWSMGDTGPCGPCSEIFYDHGPQIPGGPPGSPDADGDRYVEIWNLVFMQYDRSADGKLTPLPKPSVDTGMGLERLAAIMQGVHSNYDTDTFRTLIKAMAELANLGDQRNSSLNVVADHIRSCSFLITDGVMPSNEGRGYVLRRIIRRAVLHGYKLGIKDIFFYKLVAPLVKEMGAAYPELTAAQARVERILRLEEERFVETLEQGLRMIEQDIGKLNGTVIPGETIFRLYDTFGFPVDLTRDIALERGLSLDMAGFEKEMEAQRDRARSASQFKLDYSQRVAVSGQTSFTGYENLIDKAEVIALQANGATVDAIEAGQKGLFVLDRTPFYAESGGQVGDRGLIESDSGEFEVEDTQKQPGGTIVHIGQVRFGSFKIGDKVEARINKVLRQATMRNHSATHLLHAVLRHLFGDHVTQKGSLVDSERLRFDFSHFEPVTPDQLAEIERRVNAAIRGNSDVETHLMNYQQAVASGAMALFGEKYGDEVRVLKIGDASTELCGGTHVHRAGDIGLFKIVNEGGVAAGVRRIEAVTGEKAMAYIHTNEQRLLRVADLMKSGRDEVDDKVQQFVERYRKLEKEIEQLKGRVASSQGSDLAAKAVEINGTKVLAARLDGVDPKALRDTVDQLKNKLATAVIVLGTALDGKVSLVAGVTPDRVSQISAGELINMVAKQVGGKGGGRADMAQAGGTEPAGLDGALASVMQWVRDRL